MLFHPPGVRVGRTVRRRQVGHTTRLGLRWARSRPARPSAGTGQSVTEIRWAYPRGDSWIGMSGGSRCKD